MTQKELILSVRKKNPELKNIDDATLVKKLIEKNPNLKNLISDIPKVKKVEPVTEMVEKKGLLKSVVQGIAKPFIKTASTGQATLEAAEMALKGDWKGASAALEKERNYGFLGKSKAIQVGEKVSGANVKEALGTSLGMASTIAPFTGIPNVTGAVGRGAVKQSFLQGAKTFGTVGMAEGTGRDLSSGKTVGESIVGGVKTGALGAVTGGLFSAAGAKIAGNRLNKIKLLDKKTQKLAEYISPKLSKTEREFALKSGRAVNGKVLPDDRAIKVAKEVKDIVNPNLSPEKNISALNNSITTEAENLKKVVSQHNAIYNKKTIQNIINKVKNSPERQLTFATDANAENAYKKSVETFMRVLDKQPKKNLENLLQARKDFDKLLVNAGAFEGKNTAMKIAARDVRNAINEYIGQKVGGDGVVKAMLSKQSNYFTALDNLIDKYESLVGKGFLQRFQTLRPNTTKALKAAGYVTGAGAAFGTVKNIVD